MLAVRRGNKGMRFPLSRYQNSLTAFQLPLPNFGVNVISLFCDSAEPKSIPCWPAHSLTGQLVLFNITTAAN